MHAVFVVSQIDGNRLDEAEKMLRENIAPRIKEAPGFVAGTWARSADGSDARSAIIFESEEAARATLEAITSRMPTDGPVTIKSSSVLEVSLHVPGG